MLDSIEILLSPFITLLVVQSIKLATDGIRGNFNFKNVLIAYGGMPSSHAAVVTSLTTMVGYQAGISSPVFAMALIFSLIVIGDTMALRHHMDKKGEAIIKLISRLPPAEQKEFPHLSLKLEHTFPQVLVGSAIGFIIATLVHLI